MSLQAHALPPVPEETARVARAAFPKGNRYLLLRDVLGPLYADEQFGPLFARRGQPGHSPAQLALITVLQFLEDLSDGAAADAVRSRIDWKYLLGLELTDPGFDASVLVEFRGRLLAGDAEALLLDRLLTLARERGWLKARGRQRTDSTHILAAIRTLNRLELVGEAMRHALNRLAEAVPDWLVGWVPPEWAARYAHRVEQFRLPKALAAQPAWAEQVGREGVQLLQACWAPDAPAAARQLPAVDCVRRIWVQQFAWDDEQLRWRTVKELPPAARLIESPYDCEARFSVKRDTEWTGYKVQLTESCDEDGPHLITQVTTTVATTPDQQLLTPIHQALAAKDLLPAEHLVDAGYPTAANLVTSQAEHGVDVVGPVGRDTTWQARADQGYDVACFAIAWDQQQVTCPQGRTSRYWSNSHDEWGQPVIHVGFAASACRPCPAQATCTRAAGPRHLKLRPKDQHLALQAARQRQATPQFKARYARRAGIESTHAQGLRVCDLRRSRYWGLAKTHLQHVASAVALNLTRLADWLAEPVHTPRPASAFAALMGIT